MATTLKASRDGHLKHRHLAANGSMNTTSKTGADTGAEPDSTAAPPSSPRRLRLKLATVEDVRRELGRVYREARAGQRNVSDASRLAHVLAVLARLIEGSDLEKRIAALEAAAAANSERTGWTGTGSAATGTARRATQ